MPEKWEQRIISTLHDDYQINELRADERADDQEGGREIYVVQRPVEADIKPEDFLNEQDQQRLVLRRGAIQPTKVGPFPGIARQAVEMNDRRQRQFDFCACAILPDGWAINITMVVHVQPTPEDKALFDQIVDSVQPAGDLPGK